MEDYVAAEKRPLAKCVEDVAEADIYIGVFAWRYGYIPKEDNPESLSITELEYRAAGEHRKERLIFLLRDDARVSGVHRHAETRTAAVTPLGACEKSQALRY